MCNIHVMEISEREKKRKTQLFETIILRIFPKLMSNTKPQIRKLREHKAGEMTKSHLGTSTSNQRKSSIMKNI